MLLASQYRWRWEWLAGLCRERGYTMGAELGVKEGRTTSFLLSKEPALRMVAVDLWDQVPPNAQETYAHWDWTDIKAQYTTRVAPYETRLLTLQMDTVEAAAECQRRGLVFDFVFIDADHSFKGVCRDIDAWFPLVRAGGTLCGHDIDWQSVQDAVAFHFGTSWRSWRNHDNAWFVYKETA